MEGFENNNKENMFVELAKVKTQAPRVTVSTDADDESEGRLTVDVYQTKDEIVVQSAVAGVDIDDLEINITSESITIRGKRERTDTASSRDYFYRECFWGTFSRSIILPAEVDPDKATAELKKGVLTVHMPKISRSKGKKLKVKTIE